MREEGGGGRRSQSRVGLGRGGGGGVICSTLTALVECPNHFIIDGNIFKQGFPQNFNATLRYFPSTVFYNAFSCSKVGLGLYRPTRSRPLNNLKDRISFFPICSFFITIVGILKENKTNNGNFSLRKKIMIFRNSLHLQLTIFENSDRHRGDPNRGV